ncbi:MAG: hypothetical protein MJZ53_06565 [Paludibacteraceae bacterium]|nr:hypothetical protein [Paludibacteraceae bacterium]
MKKLLTLCLLAVSMCAIAQTALPKIAVYVTGNDDINPMLANRLVSTIVGSQKYTAVERSAAFLTELSKEQTYQRSGAVDDDEISRLGKQFGVQFVCVASVADVWGEKYISSRIISVETGNVVTTASAFGSINDAQQLIMSFNQLSKTLVSNMNNSANDNAKKVAVYVTKTGNRDVDIILGDQLVAGFSKSNKYLAIERTNGFLSQLSKEQAYQASGAVNDEDVARLGKQFGVNYVCVAQTMPFAGTYFISTRLVDVETADIVNTYDAEGKKLSNTKEVVTVSREIADNLSGRITEETNRQMEALYKVDPTWKKSLSITPECAENIALLHQAVKDKNYADAEPIWQSVYIQCPNYGKIIYTDGVKILRYKCEHATSETTKKQYLNQLMELYDKRIFYFGDDPQYPIPYILGEKGVDYVVYSTNPEIAYPWLKECVMALGDKSKLKVLETFVEVSVHRYNMFPSVYKAQLMQDYKLVRNHLLSILANNPEKSTAITAKMEHLDALYEGSVTN